MQSLRILAAAAALTVLAGAAQAREHLVMGPYPGPPAWKTATLVDKGLRHLREQIPAGQNIDSYHDILVDEVFPDARGTDPAQFLNQKFAQISGACEGIRVNGPRAGTENGYKIAYGQVFCSRQKGQKFGVNIFFKVIEGDDALYSIHREFRVPPSATAGVQSYSKDQMGELQALMKSQMVADHYLVEQVVLCGPRGKDKRCGK
jgi:hypothetical protein